MLLQIRILWPLTSPHPLMTHQWKYLLTPTLSHLISPPIRLTRSTLLLLRSGFSTAGMFKQIILGMKHLSTDSFRSLWRISLESFMRKSIGWHPLPPPLHPPQSLPPLLLL